MAASRGLASCPCSRRAGVLGDIVSATLTQPNDIARATLRQLATRRWPPTPTNYVKVYQQISGDADESIAPAKLTATLAALLVQALELGVAARLPRSNTLADETREAARLLRNGAETLTVDELAARLKALWPRIAAGDRNTLQIEEGLTRLLRLVIDNATELTPEADWMHGQLMAVKELIAGPLDARAIDAVHRKLREAVYQQGFLKRGLDEVKSAFKQMMSKVIQRTGDLGAATGDYHTRLGALATRMGATQDIAGLSALMDEAMRETRSVQASAMRSREELLDARRQVEASEQKIKALEQELQRASARAREDHLTGALNRRGLEEAFDGEAAAAARHGQILTLALLDLDNFKRLNDDNGHDAGDAALVHLANTVRQALRPFDRFARLGGEEFLIVLPRTSVADAAEIVRRLQRALIRHFFLRDGRQLLITFSAGVTAFVPGETQADAIARADKALYEAKQTGKNRVVTH